MPLRSRPPARVGLGMSHESKRVCDRRSLALCAIAAVVGTGTLAQADVPQSSTTAGPDAATAAVVADELVATTVRLSPRYDFAHVLYGASGDGDVGAWDVEAQAAQPVAVGRGYGVALIAGYHLTQLLPEATNDTFALHRFEASLGGGGMLAPGWSLRGFLGAAYASDLEDASWKAMSATASSDVLHVVGPSDA